MGFSILNNKVLALYLRGHASCSATLSMPMFPLYEVAFVAMNLML